MDIYSKVIDHTRPSSRKGMMYSYNTYSQHTIENWLLNLVKSHAIHKFIMPIDLVSEEKGLGTYTVRLESGNRLQLSAGMLLNWGILEIQK